MKTITLRNSFHNTTARVRIYPDTQTLLTASTVRRLRRELCGMSDCRCGGALGQRGHQDGIEQIAGMATGEALIIPAEE